MFATAVTQVTFLFLFFNHLSAYLGPSGGYFGPQCTLFDCALTGPGECLHGGTCYDVPGSPPTFFCNCTTREDNLTTAGYYGPHCNLFDCNGNPCYNNGTCISPNVCDCNTSNGYH